LELCSNRPEGGTTPSLGFVQAVVDRFASTNVQVHALIRPRPGDFVYTPSEFDVMLRDILAVRSCGADGVVCGIIDAQGKIDVERMKVVRQYSSKMILTFHRCFDLLSSSSSLESDFDLVLREINCDRLLTSGKSSSVCTLEGLDNLAHLVAFQKGSEGGWAKGKAVVAAAGINEQNVASLISATGVRAIHVGNSVCGSAGPVEYSSSSSSSSFSFSVTSAVTMGPSSNGQTWDAVRSDKVQALVAAAGTQWATDDLPPPPPPPPPLPLPLALPLPPTSPQTLLTYASPFLGSGSVEREKRRYPRLHRQFLNGPEAISSDSLDDESGEGVTVDNPFATENAGTYILVTEKEAIVSR